MLDTPQTSQPASIARQSSGVRDRGLALKDAIADYRDTRSGALSQESVDISAPHRRQEFGPPLCQDRLRDTVSPRAHEEADADASRLRA